VDQACSATIRIVAARSLRSVVRRFHIFIFQ
jgi:hypothetical protein